MKTLMRDEKGQALVLTLLLLLIGSLIVSPTLSLMGTGLKSGRVYEQKNDEIYAADAGVEDAMWRIRNDTMDDLLGAGYSHYDYSSAYQYPYNLFVNGKNVTVSIQNVWLPTGMSQPDAATAEKIIDDEKLMIMGYPDAAASTYDIKIVYYGSEDLNVKTLGIWLSSGFEYSEYSGSCPELQGQTSYRAPTISLDKGGCAVVWSFASPYPSLKYDFPEGSSGNPTVKIFTLKYSGPQGQIPELVASWIAIDGVVPGTTYSCSWDDTIRLYKIASQAGAVQIDAYGAKTRFRKLKSAISGNYLGTGNTLIGGTEDGDNNIHYLLYRSTSATVATNDHDDTLGIPSDATVEAAYLYWTGWIDWHDYEPPESGSQTRYPSGDISSSGTWSPNTNMYQYVNEQGSHDSDATYLLHGTWSGSALFSFPDFTVDVPTGMVTRGLTVSLVARDDTYGYNSMRPAIRVGGSNYYGYYSQVPTDYGTISYTWAENPRTNQAWTEDQINGIGSNALQGFGVSSNDASPRIRLTQVYATVGWGYSLVHPDSPTQETLSALVEDTARVNEVLFNDVTVTADKWQTLYPDVFKDSSTYYGTWYYTCKTDVTDLLEAWIDEGDKGIASNGAGTYTVGHIAAPNEEDPSYSFSFASGGGSTGYPLGTPAPEEWDPPTRYTAAHAGWSLLILYSCASVYNHQYYLYDIQTPGFSFFFGWNEGQTYPCTLADPDWDNDGDDGGIISGFLVPPRVGTETNAARITVMVGEGDKADGSSGNCYCKDRFKVNGTALSDGTGLPDVWNGNSIGLPADAGIDIDQFFVTWASGILEPMDVSAVINVPTGTDGFTVSYMLFQFRSQLGVGGVITNYAISVIS